MLKKLILWLSLPILLLVGLLSAGSFPLLGDSAKPPCHPVKGCPTTTVATTTTGTTTSPPSGALWDGSATMMTCLWKTTIYDLGQCPAGFWSGLGFIDNDVQLVADPTYRQIYRHRTKQGSGNGFYKCPITCAASYLAHGHSPDLHTTIWYADTIKVRSPYTCTDWGLVLQLNYGLSSPPMNLALNCDQTSDDGQLHFGLDRNGGGIACASCQGFPSYQHTQMNLGPFLDRWVDWVIGIHWETDNSGWFEYYSRTKANGEEGFTLRLGNSGVATMQYIIGQPLPAYLDDKQDLYFGYWDSTRIPATGFPANYVDHTGLQRHTDKASAIASRS